MTDAEAAQLAESCAKSLTRRWGGRHDWREIVGACWEGIDRAMRAGGTDRRYLFTGAKLAALRYLTATGKRGWGRAGKLRVYPLTSVAEEDGDSHYGALEPATADRPDSDRRLLALWCETRAERAAWSHIQRVQVYLYCVEGMTVPEVAAATGRNEKAVQSSIVKAVGPGMLRACGAARHGERQRTCAARNPV